MRQHYSKNKLIHFSFPIDCGIRLVSILLIDYDFEAKPEMPEQAHRPGKAVRFSIGSQASSPINEAITASNMNI